MLTRTLTVHVHITIRVGEDTEGGGVFTGDGTQLRLLIIEVSTHH